LCQHAKLFIKQLVSHALLSDFRSGRSVVLNIQTGVVFLIEGCISVEVDDLCSLLMSDDPCLEPINSSVFLREMFA
jgi:hypothetical protein